MIAGLVKGFNMPIDYVLYEMSFANTIMYGATIPSYSIDEKNKKNEDVIRADDPNEKDNVRKFLNKYR